MIEITEPCPRKFRIGNEKETLFTTIASCGLFKGHVGQCLIVVPVDLEHTSKGDCEETTSEARSEMSTIEYFCPSIYVELAFEKMKNMQKEDSNSVPAEFESVIVSVADYYGLLNYED